MKVAIVGGTGNISQPIVRRLLEKGHAVTCVNRASRPVESGARLLQIDRQDRDRFEQTMQAERFDAAIDMICFNAEDAASSVRAFRGVGWFVQTSTVNTYGPRSDYFPVDESHPLRPEGDYAVNKAAADDVFLAAWHTEKFPAVILKPSTTYGPIQGMLRQVAWEFSWIDRIRKGKPILVCGDGNALHQHLHVEDIAAAFAGVIGQEQTRGQIYNAVNRGFTTWADYHLLAGKILGRESELVGVPLADLKRCRIPKFDICEMWFSGHRYYASEKLFRAVPEFQPRITLEQGMAQVFEAMERAKRIPDSDELSWEDDTILGKREKQQGCTSKSPGTRSAIPQRT